MQPPFSVPAGGWRRRDVMMASVAALGLPGAASAQPAAAEAPIRVAWISPQTGVLSAFGVTDRFVHGLLAPRLRAGLDGADGSRRAIDVSLHDAASSPGKARELAESLVAAGVQMIVATATPEICNPVADTCEAAKVPCLSTIVPWQAWYFARGGSATRRFDWTYHFFCGLEDFADVYSALMARASLGQKVGGLFGDDIDADAFLGALPAAFRRRGLDLQVPVRPRLAQPDWIDVATRFRNARIDMVTGVLPPPQATDFLAAARTIGYTPRMASIAKAFPFPETVQAVHRPGLTLTNEVWWSPAWPFSSALTGMRAPDLAKAYEDGTGRQWVQTLGFSHALLDVVAQACRTARTSDRAGLRESLARVRVNTVTGPISFLDPHPNRNVCTTPAVGGQWMRDAAGRWVLQVVDNSRSPFIPKTAELTIA